MEPGKTVGKTPIAANSNEIFGCWHRSEDVFYSRAAGDGGIVALGHPGSEKQIVIVELDRSYGQKPTHDQEAG